VQWITTLDYMLVVYSKLTRNWIVTVLWYFLVLVEQEVVNYEILG
jgi:hypothetical protein